MNGMERNEMRTQEKHERQERQERQEDGPRNYGQPEPLNVGLVGRSVSIVMADGSIQAGILRAVGQYFISLEIANKRTLIVNKSGILTLAVN
jgi:hypothetical protein